MTKLEAYRAAILADEAFSAHLHRVYGKDAPNKRYVLRHDDPLLMIAMNNKLAADRAHQEATAL